MRDLATQGRPYVFTSYTGLCIEPRPRNGDVHSVAPALYLRSIPLQKKLLALAEAHLDDADREVRNMATALFVHSERLFTFLDVEGVEPTNNVAERTLRTA